jgi:zinc transport system ATP-binding protein
MSINSIPAISITDVNYSIQNYPILENITFDIKEGEYMAIIGPNGAGKTTLLKIILGLLQPDSGEVNIFGQSREIMKEKYIIGYIPQRVSATIYRFPATVEEIIRSGRTARVGMFRAFSKTDFDAVEKAMERADVTKYRNKSISELSGGELQRVFIARALATEPKILILDEPTVGVDPQTQAAFYEFIEDLNHKLNLTIVIVTHEVDVALHRAHFVLCLNKQLVCHVPSSELLKGKYLEKLYGESMHVVHHEHKH